MNIGMSDAILYDRSPRRNNGTFSNVSWVQLPSGLWVANFNGADSYIEIADSPSMRMTNGGTIVTWVKANNRGESNVGRIIDKSSGTSGENGYRVLLNANNSFSMNVNAGTSTASTNNALPYGIWTMIGIVFSASGRVFYSNASPCTSSGSSQTGLPPNVAGVTSIGNRAGNTDSTFDGYIALPKIYGKALTQAEIARLFNSQRGFFGV